MINRLDFKSIKRGVRADWYRIPIWPHAESRKGTAAFGFYAGPGLGLLSTRL